MAFGLKRSRKDPASSWQYLFLCNQVHGILPLHCQTQQNGKKAKLPSVRKNEHKWLKIHQGLLEVVNTWKRDCIL